MPIFKTPEPISVTIEVGSGDARIIASDRADTIVEVRPRSLSNGSDVKAAEQIRVEYSGGRLLIKAVKDWKRYLGRSGTIDVTIDLPTGSRLYGRASSGELRCEGQFGACRLETAFGDIRLDRAGTLHVRTAHGDISVDRASGDADAGTGSGRIRIREIIGKALISNANGDTDIGDVTGDLYVKAANGDVIVGRARRSVVAKTANGNVRIGEVAHGAIVIDTAAGELEVGIPEGIAAWLDVSSQHGSVRNALDPTDGPDSSAATVEIRARTGCGDILIGRPPAGPTYHAQ